mmetsp:Transcript_36660/g.6564  ORF Transcript_36660/g.6564 Transcript_36660/m.6564 type:complete len:84 (+) Transcript_36660:21-272(+)
MLDFLTQIVTPKEVADDNVSENSSMASDFSMLQESGRNSSNREIEEAREIFSILDVSQQGKISVEDIYRALAMLGEDIDMQEA